MLIHLHVKNLALIEEAEVDFGPGLNILTGETGAGKSILLGSMQLILGSRVSRNMIRSNASFALVELLFEVEDEAVVRTLKDLEIEPEDGQVLLSRRITDGKSVNKINGETCTVTRMKEAASCLLDIHGQHEHQTLLQPQKQLEILDSFGREKIAPASREVAEAFECYRKCCADIKALDIGQAERSREISFLEFEIGEIGSAGLKDKEDEELERKFRRMSNSRRIMESLSRAQQMVSPAGEEGAASLVGEACRELRQAAELDEGLFSLRDSLDQVDALMGDFTRELDAYMEEMSFDEEQFYQVGNRLDLLNSLKAKYGQSIPEIFAYRDRQQARLNDLMTHEERLGQLRSRQAAAKKELDQACRTLSALRQEYAAAFTDKIIEGLKDLNFLDVRFQILFTRKKAYAGDGFDEVEYQISTNPGEALKPLGEIVSGGELSRIMLAIKSILADRDHVETLIFDEIDAGISGRTAQKVSEKMAVIGRHHQVLCITHLPQIAAMADRHFEISKGVGDGVTTTRIRLLEEEESALELARLLSGAETTDAVLDNAREMKRLANRMKAE